MLIWFSVLYGIVLCLFFFKQKTAYEMRISDWIQTCALPISGVRFTGRLTLARLGDLPARLDALGPIAALDLSDIERIDTVGAWIVTRPAHEHDAEVIGASEDAPPLLKATADDQSD